MRFSTLVLWVVIQGLGTNAWAAKRCNKPLENGKRAPAASVKSNDSDGDADTEKARKKLISAFARLAKQTGDYPSLRETATEANLTMKEARAAFDDVLDLRQAALEQKPDSFKNVVDSTVFNPTTLKRLQDRASRAQRFFFTTAVAEAEVFEPAFLALEKWTRTNKAMALIQPQANLTALMAPDIAPERLVFEDIDIGSTLRIKNTGVTARDRNPLQGVRGMADGRTMIVGSPKQDMEHANDSHADYPYAIVTTGAITLPKYQGKYVHNQARDRKAEKDHVMGGLIVEMLGDKQPFFRHVQFLKDGSFYDLQYQYFPDGTRKAIRPQALVLGDWHVGSTDPGVVKATDSMIQELKPKEVVFHDLFDGYSVNHHERDQATVRARKALDNRLSLERELQEVADELLRFVRNHGFLEKLFIVKSNHDEFLDRYINDFAFREDPANMAICSELMALMIRHQVDALQAGVHKYWRGSPEEFAKIEWGTRNSDHYVGSIQLASHGDKGINGTKNPSLAQIERAYVKAIVGHSHSGAKLRGVLRVGTGSILRPGYVKGPSTWTHTHAIVYENDCATTIDIRDGIWRPEN